MPPAIPSGGAGSRSGARGSGGAGGSVRAAARGGKRPRRASVPDETPHQLTTTQVADVEDDEDDEEDDEAPATAEEYGEEEALNSDDDEAEEEGGDEGEGGARYGGPTDQDMLLVCQYEKVKRKRDTWRVAFKSGTGSIFGVAFAFARCDAELTY